MSMSTLYRPEQVDYIRTYVSISLPVQCEVEHIITVHIGPRKNICVSYCIENKRKIGQVQMVFVLDFWQIFYVENTCIRFLDFFRISPKILGTFRRPKTHPFFGLALLDSILLYAPLSLAA
jgi:hypothetical protein